MQWLNEPVIWHDDTGTLRLTTDAQTDFWRKTHDGGIRDNGHFYFQSVTGDFTAEVKVTGAYQALYDHAGIMVRRDEATWLKCGIEYVDGVQYASAVVTRDYSDWSILPLKPAPPHIFLRVKRDLHTLEVSYSPDGETYTLIRQAFLTTEETVDVGLMAAAPKGEGFEVAFEGFTIQ
jgi:hypothetical protein